MTEHDGDLIVAITGHLEALWGEPARAAWFQREDGRSYAISKWLPAVTKEGVFLYVTTGASLSPGTGGPSDHRTEFFLGLDEEVDGVAPTLAAVASYAADRGVDLGHGHTIPAGGSLWTGTEMDHILILRQRREVVPSVRLDATHVEFLQAVPLYQSERDRKVKLGLDGFLEEWEELGVPFWSPRRPPAAPDSL